MILYKPADLEAFVLGRIGITIKVDGVFSLSSALTKLLNLTTEDKMLIGQSEDNPMDMYLLRHDEGFPLRYTGSERIAMGFTNKKLRNIIFKATGLEDKTYSFLVSKEPIDIDGMECYTIITKSAKHSTRRTTK